MNDKGIKGKLAKTLEKISNNGIYTVVLSPEDYHAAKEAILDYLIAELNKKGIYVTLNMPCDDLFAKLKGRKIDTSSLYVIDGASKTKDKGAAASGNCTYISNPESLTELSLIITNMSNTGRFHFLILDSITTLLVYNSSTTIEKFVHYIINKARNLDMELILLSINEENSKKLLPILSQFCDDCIYV